MKNCLIQFCPFSPSRPSPWKNGKTVTISLCQLQFTGFGCGVRGGDVNGDSGCGVLCGDSKGDNRNGDGDELDAVNVDGVLIDGLGVDSVSSVSVVLFPGGTEYSQFNAGLVTAGVVHRS
jgi:hypothetical protein